MPYPADGTLALLGRGEVYFDRFDSAGAKTGERFLGNVSKVEITPSIEDAKLYSSSSAASELLARAVIRQTHEVSLTLTQYDKENVALSLMGDNSTLVQSTVASGDEVIASIKLDRWTKLADRNVTVTAVKKTAGAVAMALNVDYKVDGPGGRIYIMPSSVIVVDGDGITVTRSAAAKTYQTVRAGVVGKIEGQLRYIGVQTSGPIVEAEIWKLSLTPDGALALIQGDAYGEYTLKGEALSDATNHATEPFYRVIYR